MVVPTTMQRNTISIAGRENGGDRSTMRCPLASRILHAYLTRPFATLYPHGHLCPVCASLLTVTTNPAICDELADDWRLDAAHRHYFDYREGCLCTACASSARIRNLARALLEVVNAAFGQNVQSVHDMVENTAVRSARIAEINACGRLHHYLCRLPALSYSEYRPDDPTVNHEDLTALTYPRSSFDIVLMSDVLEHVSDWHKALHEIRRVLRRGGYLVFTVPYLHFRKTRTRAVQGTTGVRHLMKPSYHGDYRARLDDHLVFNEFGYDLLYTLMRNFRTAIYGRDPYGGFTNSVFVCRRA